MSKLLITGGTGFFGKNVLKYILTNESLYAKFSEVMVLTRKRATDFLDEYPEFIHPKITFHTSDVRTFEYTQTDIEYIMHLATDASKDLNDNHPEEMIDVIIDGTKNILKIAHKQKELKAFLFASSGAVYGNIPENLEGGVQETQRFDIDFNNPLNAYAQAKQTAEMLCSIYKERHCVPIVIARCFAFYGDYFPTDRHFAIQNFIQQAKENQQIVIRSDGMSKRSYLHSSDLAKCLLELLNAPSKKDYIFNVGSEDGKTLKEWANEIAKKNGNIKVEILNEPQKGYRAGNNYIPNIERLKKIIKL